MNIREIKGIGEKTEKLFNKLGVVTTWDLLEYYPRNYDEYTAPVTIGEIDSANGIPAIFGTIISEASTKQIRNLKILTVFIKDKNGEKLKLTWFNMPFLKNTLKMGYKYVFRGQIKTDRYGKNPSMDQPAIFSLGDYEKKLGILQPIYPLTAGLSNNMVTKSVKSVLDSLGEKNGSDYDYLPETVRQRAGLMGYLDAVKTVHFPTDREDRKSVV